MEKNLKIKPVKKILTRNDEGNVYPNDFAKWSNIPMILAKVIGNDFFAAQWNEIM